MQTANAIPVAGMVDGYFRKAIAPTTIQISIQIWKTHDFGVVDLGTLEL
jgi:hypothetical protein